MPHTKRIEIYIRELLYIHECVTVPGLGSFLAKESSALSEFAHCRILPPAKTVSYNGQIQDNDGLLIRYISQEEQISYAEAKAYVEQSCRDIQEAIEKQGYVQLKGLGQLQKQEHGQLLFRGQEAGDLRLAEYGLPVLRAVPILRQEPRKQTDKPVQEMKKASFDFSKLSFSKIASAAVVIGIALSAPFWLSWMQGGNGHTPQSGAQQAGLLEDLQRSEQIQENQAEKRRIEEAKLDINPSPEAPQPASQELEPTPEEEPQAEEKPVPAELAAPKNLSQVASHIVVVGAFSNLENVETMVSAMRTDGYTLRVESMPERKLNRVDVLLQCQNEAEFQSKLADIRKKYSKGAWLLKK